MQSQAVLMMTENSSLWQSWQQLAQHGWQPKQGATAQDLQAWRAAGCSLVIWDMALLEKQQWLAQNWLQLFSGLRVLVLSAHMSDEQGQLVLGKGACGYHHTHAMPDALSRILASLADGAIWMGPSLLHKLLHDIDQRLVMPEPKNVAIWMRHLSPREVQVAQHAAVGDSNVEIAEKMGITERTVRAHLSAIFEKLHINDRLKLALIVHGIRDGMP
jgi:DNA-binding NarL/FixJ family response regulator